eukprot:3740847-Prymnesium_polylepis.1
MHVVYNVLTSRKSTKGKATKKHWGSLCDVITRWREDGVRLMWINFIGNSVHRTAISLPIEVHLPERWAELAQFLALTFRPYT